MGNLVDVTNVKLGHGFSSVGGSKEIDLGPEDRPRLTYVNAKSNPEYKPELIRFIKGNLKIVLRCLA